MLNKAMLYSYEDCLRAQGVPVDEWARPGLSEAEMEETLAPIGLRLPIEGRLWWGWHDGANPPTGRETMLGPWREFISLAEAVQIYETRRRVAEEVAQSGSAPMDSPDFIWNRAWLPITGGGQPTVIDCSVKEGAPTPLRFIDAHDLEDVPELHAASLGEVVETRIKIVDSGAWRFDTERNEWDINESLLGRAVRINPVF